MTQVRPQSLEGVGIGYHPFLHRTILARPDCFDLVELPLESYLDEAQRSLLDPDLARVGAVAEARLCVWRGSALSLGSAVPPDTAGIETTLRRLVERTHPVLLREDFAFRRVEGHDLGLPQPSPPTAAMAEIVARRCETLRPRLPCRLAIGLSLDALAGASQPLAAAFLRHLTVATDCDIAFDLGPAEIATGPSGLASLLGGVPAGRVVQVALTSTEAAVWPVLDAVLASTGARSVVIRRTRNLFPLEDILGAAAQAREALDRAAAAPRSRLAADPAAAPAIAGDPDLDATTLDQAAFAARCLAISDTEPVSDAVAAVRARAVWRERVADVHRTKQLARWAERPATWRV